MNILVVSAHPDDEILGMGGTIAKLAAAGNKVYQWFYFNGENCNGIIQVQPEEVSKILGSHYPPHVMRLSIDNESDMVPLIEIARSIEHAIGIVQPQIVYTHSARDLTRDHRNVFEATLVAARPFSGSVVGQVLTYENILTTEKAFGQFGNFTPNVYEEISVDNLNAKKSALNLYSNLLNHHVDIQLLSRLRGHQIGVDYAEAFELIWMRR